MRGKCDGPSNKVWRRDLYTHTGERVRVGGGGEKAGFF